MGPKGKPVYALEGASESTTSSSLLPDGANSAPSCCRRKCYHTSSLHPPSAPSAETSRDRRRSWTPTRRVARTSRLARRQKSGVGLARSATRWSARVGCRDWGSDWEDSSGDGEERNRCVIGGCKLWMGPSRFSFVFIRLSRSYHAISKDF